MREHPGEAGRCAEERRRLHAAYLARQALEDRLWRRPLRHQQHARADAQWKGQRVTEAVGEKELRGGKANVVLR